MYYIDKNNDLGLQFCPKNGCTTIRAWVAQYLDYQVSLSNEEYYIPKVKSKVWKTENYLSVEDYYSPITSNLKVCIKRHPIDRFKSLWADKVLKEKLIEPDVDKFLGNFYNILETHPKTLNSKHKYMIYHFVPQFWHLGKKRQEYDFIFDTTELSTKLKPLLEERWNKKLLDIHARKNSNKNNIYFSKKQLNKIEEIYKNDFELGWC